MTAEEKLYDTAQRVAGLLSGEELFGPQTQWNPLSNGYSVKSPFTGAWAYAGPGSLAFLSCWIAVGSPMADGTLIGTLPSTDSEGNRLRPRTDQRVPMYCDLLQTDGTYDRSTGGGVIIHTNGQVTTLGVANNATAMGTSCGWYNLDSC